MHCLALDPGPKQTAWIWLVDGLPQSFGIQPNEVVLESLKIADRDHVLVIEQFKSYGQAIGEECIETIRWSGRFEQASFVPVLRVPRGEVKMHLCKTMRAKDANVRQALIDRFGGKACMGTKKKPGVLYGISKDVWAALAVAVTWYDQYGGKNG